jgi:hypothetical protein
MAPVERTLLALWRVFGGSVGEHKHVGTFDGCQLQLCFDHHLRQYWLDGASTRIGTQEQLVSPFDFGLLSDLHPASPE